MREGKKEKRERTERENVKEKKERRDKMEKRENGEMREKETERQTNTQEMKRLIWKGQGNIEILAVNLFS